MLAHHTQLLPVHRPSLQFRLATMDDLPFVDGLQKLHSKELGYFPTKQFEGYIEMGGVLIAEERHEGTEARRDEGRSDTGDCRFVPACLRPSVPVRLGYCISRDRYLKRDELGVIYQLCVVPDARRSLVAGALLKEVFARSAYGCRLYCCWCAQDLAANRFWEAMGFTPIAFRGGSGKKKRVHIFWQKRIVAGDTTTQWWFPSKTDGGAMREDRIVLPIPHGLRWDDEMPVMVSNEPKALPGESKRTRAKKQLAGDPSKGVQQPTTTRPIAKFGPPPSPGASVSVPIVEAPPPEQTAPAKIDRPRPEKPKCDPKIVAAARELRDRWLEAVNRGEFVALPEARYEVSRVIESAPAMPLLPAA